MSFSRILIGVDGAEGGVDALALARRLSSTATELVAISVAVLGVRHLEHSNEGYDRELREDAWARVAGLRDQQADLRIEVITAGSVAAGLHEAAASFDADLIVMGSCRRGEVGRILAGDQVSQTLRGAPCPIAIAPLSYALGDTPILTVGVGWQGNDEGDRALEVAQGVAGGIGATVHALTVVGVLELPLADGSRDGSGIDPGVSLTSRGTAATGEVQTTMVSGDPGQELERYAAEVDLLVVGSHGRGAIGRLVLGSTSERLSRHCRRPLMIAPRSAAVAGVPAWVAVERAV